MLRRNLTPSPKVKNIDNAGYYYFDGSHWVKFKGGCKTLYTQADGTLTSKRTVDMAGNSINFSGGKVGIGVDRPATMLDIKSEYAKGFKLNDGKPIQRKSTDQ